MFFKTGVLKNFAIFTGKQPCCNLQHRCLPVNVAKFYRSAFFIEHFWWLLLTIIFAKQSVYKIDCSLIFRRKISNWEKAFVYKSKYPLQ